MLLGAPAGAQMMSAANMGGMSTMQYYVGTWSCTAGVPGKPMQKATSTYTLQSGVLSETVVVPATKDMKTPYVAASATTYDAKHQRYIETWVGNDAGWSVSFAKPWTGKTENWADHVNNTGKLGRTVVVRTSDSGFEFTGYPDMTGTTPNFKGSCTR